MILLIRKKIKMKKILLIGDPHYKVSNRRETSEFEKSVLENLEEIKNLDFIVVLGDILDTHEKIHIQPLCRAVDFIIKLSKFAKTYLLIGNHDRINNNVYMSPEHPFTGLKRRENIVVVDETVREEDFAFVPYVPNGRFHEALGPDYQHFHAIFAHQEFRGCKMGALVSETGDLWDTLDPPVFSGHIHDYQQPQKNILYTGTPFQHSFGDSSEKNIFILEIDETKIWNLEPIKLDVVQKRLFNMKISEFDEFVPPENTLLKINFHCEESDIKTIMTSSEFQNKIAKYSIEYRVKVKKSEPVVKRKKGFLESLKRRIETSSRDIRETFSDIFGKL